MKRSHYLWCHASVFLIAATTLAQPPPGGGGVPGMPCGTCCAERPQYIDDAYQVFGGGQIVALTRPGRIQCMSCLT